MTKNIKEGADKYLSPSAEAVALVVEQIMASSAGTELDDMDGNEVYDELF